MSPIFIEVTVFPSKTKTTINMMQVAEFRPSNNPANARGCFFLREAGSIEITESYAAIKRAVQSAHVVPSED